MGKQSKRPGRATRDVHAAIRADAATLKSAATFGVRDADESPELAGLLTAIRKAVAAGVPRFVFFKSRNYWLRVQLTGRLDVFAQPGDAVPLVSGLSLSTEDHGHAPGH
jgi:hypothetical protein